MKILLASLIAWCSVVVGACPSSSAAPSSSIEDRASPSDPAEATAEWMRLDQTASQFPPRMSAYVIRDPERDRLVMFGGWGGDYMNDTWTLSLLPGAEWVRLATSVAPAPRLEHTTAYDSRRHRMLIFGGKDENGFFNDVWQFDLSTHQWNRVATQGVMPSVRETRAIYDPVRDRLLMFGGFSYVEDEYAAHLDETWELRLSGTPTWNQLFPSGPIPGARRGQSVAYDPTTDRMILFGGFDDARFYADVWAFDLAGAPAWRRLATTGQGPTPRFGQDIVLDPRRRELTVFGGWNGQFLNDGYVLSLATMTWSPMVTPRAPTPRDFHSMVLDPNRDRILLVGGNAGVTTLGDWWAWYPAAQAWKRLGPQISAPPERRLGHDGIVDPIQQRFVLFGGWNEDEYLDDTWSLALEGEEPTWSRIESEVDRPSGRIGFQTVYDSKRHRMLLVGGRTGPLFHGDVWELDLSRNQWSEVRTRGTAPSARETRAIYDPVRDRVLVFGGFNDDDGHLNDLWELSLTGPPTWRRLESPGAWPVPRRGHTLVYDATGDRMILYGGYDEQTFLGDVWELKLRGREHWRRLPIRGEAPDPRYLHSAVYLPERQQMVVFGGFHVDEEGEGYFLGDLWTLDLHGGGSWSRMPARGVAPMPRDFHTMVYDAPRARLILYGGNDDHGGPLGELWQLALGVLPKPGRRDTRVVTIEAPIAPVAEFTLRGFVPNPAGSVLDVHFSLPRSRPARIDLFDLAGRRITGADLATPRPGPQSLRLDGSVAPGMYLIRLTQDDLVATRRAIVVGAR